MTDRAGCLSHSVPTAGPDRNCHTYNMWAVSLNLTAEKVPAIPFAIGSQGGQCMTSSVQSSGTKSVVAADHDGVSSWFFQNRAEVATVRDQKAAFLELPEIHFLYETVPRDDGNGRQHAGLTGLRLLHRLPDVFSPGGASPPWLAGRGSAPPMSLQPLSFRVRGGN